MSTIKTSIRSIASPITGNTYLHAKDLLAWFEKSKELTDNPDVHRFIDTQISAITTLPLRHNRLQDVESKSVEV